MATMAHAAPLKWVRQIGTSLADDVRGLAVNTAGAVFVGGVTQGNLNGQTHAGGGGDAYLAKLDAAGALQWTRLVGSPALDFGLAVAVDPSGSAYVAGQTFGSLHGQTASGGGDGFVMKFAANGVREWTRLQGSEGSEYAVGVAASAGGVYVAGYTGKDYGGANAGSTDAFLTKYDAAGSVEWIRRAESNKRDSYAAVTVDVFGNVIAAGGTEGAIGVSSGGADAFLRKYNAAGNQMWTVQFGTNSEDEAVGITSDAAGNVYVTGYTGGPLGGQTNAGLGDAFLTKVNASGLVEWTRLIGGAAGEHSYGVGVDAAGRVFVSGHTASSFDGATNAGEADAFLVEFDGSGNRVATQFLGTAAADYGRALATYGTSGVLIAGDTFGALGSASFGGRDGFLAMYTSAAATGDFNGDGAVDNLDLAQWQGDFGLNVESDANGDGASNGADFLIWQRNVIGAANAVGAAATPEPASEILAACAATLIGGVAGRTRDAAAGPRQ
jgi:hypothetical protein